MIHVNYWQGRSPPLRVHCDSILVTRGCSSLELAPVFDVNVKYIPRPLCLYWGTRLKLHRTTKQEAAAFKNTRVGGGQARTGTLGDTRVGCKAQNLRESSKVSFTHYSVSQPFTDWLSHSLITSLSISPSLCNAFSMHSTTCAAYKVLRAS